MTERWKSVVGYKGYYKVSNLGRVKSLKRQQRSYGGRVWERPEMVLKPTFDGRYMVVSLTVDGVKKRPYVHDLVLTAFRGTRPEGHVGCHKDNDGRNNTLTNLRWGTQQSNVIDKLAHGTMPLGEQHWKSKYTVNQIKRVKKMLHEGSTIRETSQKTKVPETTVSAVKSGRQWSHITWPDITFPPINLYSAPKGK